MSLVGLQSFKSFLVKLIASEIGFLGEMPLTQEKIYSGYTALIIEFRKKAIEEKFGDENCNFYCQKREKIVKFEVDPLKDTKILINLMKVVNATKTMYDSKNNDNYLVLVNNILFVHVGNAINENDDYFDVLKEMWTTFILDNELYKNNFEKIKQNKIDDLKQKFYVKNERIDELMSIG